MHPFATLDRWLEGLARPSILLVAAGVLVLVGLFDYASGNELSVGLFYLAPVALVAWYAGRWPAILIAVAGCVSWYLADLLAGSLYTHSAIAVWNALVRLGFFLITGLLLVALRSSLNEQRDLARTDSLTGLYARRAFRDRLEHDLALAQRHKSPVSLAYIDLDDFKSVNDTYGHAEGDRVLSMTAGALRNAVRQADTAARLGGDEFALILPDTDGHGAQRVIANLTRELQQAYQSLKTKVSCSIGVVTFMDPGIPAEKAVAAADALMYEVKRKGKGTAAFEVLAGRGL